MPESVSGWRHERCRVKTGPSRRATDQRKAHGSDGVNNAHGAVVIVPGANGGVFDSRSDWADCPGCPKCRDQDGYVLRRGNGRPTRAWERLLLFAKRGGAFYDCEAVREPLQASSLERGYAYVGQEAPEKMRGAPADVRAKGDWRANTYIPSARNARDWRYWEVEPLRDQHYAAFPSGLPAFAIKAGTSEWGCCPGCGAPWARCIERRPVTRVDTAEQPGRRGAVDGWRPTDDPTKGNVGLPMGALCDGETTTTGWRPTCRCSPVLPPLPCRVLDPFGGSGTTALAANRLGRDCTLVELKADYARLARRRIGREPLSLFAFAGQEALGAPGPDPPALEATKQEGHPNRTVAGFNQRWAAKHGAVGALE
jgi:hypothetical protein